jgi:hypothetical protein
MTIAEWTAPASRFLRCCKSSPSPRGFPGCRSDCRFDSCALRQDLDRVPMSEGPSVEDRDGEVAAGPTLLGAVTLGHLTGDDFFGRISSGRIYRTNEGDDLPELVRAFDRNSHGRHRCRYRAIAEALETLLL